MTTFQRLSVRIAVTALALVMVVGTPVVLDSPAHEAPPHGPAIANANPTPTPTPTLEPDGGCVDIVCG